MARERTVFPFNFKHVWLSLEIRCVFLVVVIIKVRGGNFFGSSGYVGTLSRSVLWRRRNRKWSIKLEVPAAHCVQIVSQYHALYHSLLGQGKPWIAFEW